MQVSGAQRRVGIGGAAEQGRQIALGSLELIEAADHRHAHAHLLTIGINREVHRIDEGIDDVAEQVAHRGGADDRNEQVRAGPDVITAERIAERAQMVRDPGRPDHVDHAGHAGGRIDHETNGRLGCAQRAQLQYIVDHHPRLTEVDQDVVDGFADHAGGQKLIDRADWPKAVPRQRHLQVEALAVEPLEWIIDLRHRGFSGESETRVAKNDRRREGDAAQAARCLRIDDDGR